MEKIVFVVHCVDTEGPLYESLEATFERVNDIFSLNLKPSEELLKKLQEKKVDLGGKEDAVYNVVAPKRINMNKDWNMIRSMLNTITSNDFRCKYPDSYGGFWIYNWFCIDNVGFNGVNPRRRELGHHKIFDFYTKYNEEHNLFQDMIQWHFHPLSPKNDATRSGTTYLNSSNVTEILARKIIDRCWFPSSYRPGFHTTRPDSNWFLEQWIPIEYANQSKHSIDDSQEDLSNGRFGDWRRAPLEWVPYNPDLYDYQKKGNLKRYIARCLNMDARIRQIEPVDVEEAFTMARQRGSSLLSFTNHDVRDMTNDIIHTNSMITDAAKKYPDIKFKFVNALEGFRMVCEIKKTGKPDFEFKLLRGNKFDAIRVKTKNQIFGPQPFLALKLKNGAYFWENFDFQNDNIWTFTFDSASVELDEVESIGIAANSPSGVTEVLVYNLLNDKTEHSIYNDER